MTEPPQPLGILPELRYTRYTDPVFCLADTDGGNIVEQGPALEAWQFVWSPDSTRTAVATIDGVRIATPDGQILCSLTEFGTVNITWSPDGQHIAHNRGTEGIWVTRAGGRHQTRLVDHEGTSLSWSPDSRRIAYIHRQRCRSSPNGSPEAYRRLRILDCHMLGYPPKNRGVWTVGLDGQVIRVTGDDACRVAWSPDGTTLAYSTCRDGLYGIAADGSGHRRLTNDHAYVPVWCPDGTRLAYSLRGGGVCTVRVGGEEHEQVTDDDAKWLQWSPDGTVLLYGVEFTDHSGYGVVTLDLASGTRNLVDFPAVCPAWTPDGKNICYVKQGGLEVYSYSEACQDRRPKRVPARRIVWSTDGDRFAYPAGDQGLYVAHPDDDICERLVDHPSKTQVWSPTGDRLAYLRPGRELWVVDIGGWAWEVRGAVERVVWSPDGTRLAYTDLEGRVWTCEADGTGNSICVSKIEGGQCAVSWSTDGLWLAYTREDGGVFLSDPVGKQNRQLSTDRTYLAVWSPDATKIAYHISGGVVTVDVVERTRRQLVEEYASGFVWAPDSQGIAYTLFGSRGIFVYSFAASASRRLSTSGDGLAVSTGATCGRPTVSISYMLRTHGYTR